MGQLQHTTEGNGSTRGRRLRPRICLRQGCGRTYQPRRWNQRYCQDPDCQRQVRRWQAAKRQRKRRGDADGREKHAQTERERRKRRQAESYGLSADGSSSGDVRPPAWSRSKKFPETFCDRPGCYAAARSSDRAPARYCGDACRSALGRVRDRERKWLRRTTSAGRYKRQLEYERARRRRRGGCGVPPAAGRQDVPARPRAVVNYRASPPERLTWPGWKEDRRDDRETSAGSGPRSPPTR
jgi:hypothetical protein